MSQQARVLIADDEEAFSHVVARYLSNSGYTCTCVNDASAAARMLLDQPFDVLISDIKMPGNCNLQLIHDIQKNAPTVPVILITGSPSVDTAISAVRLPVFAYLLKPVDFDELLPLLEQAVARGRLMRLVGTLRIRLKNWNAELDQLSESLDGSGKLPLAEPAGILLGGIFDTLIASLGDMGHALSTLHATENVMPPSESSIIESKMKKTRETLQDAIVVLEQSKDVFKSKRLGDIRKQFQGLLDNLTSK